MNVDFIDSDPKKQRCRWILLLALASTAILTAQAPEQRPTFQVSVNYVDVDVTVTDAQGQFVTGLTADDFEVFEDGKPQQIQTFSYIELPIERANRFQAFGRPVPADVRSNRDVSSGRVYVIVLDDLNVAPIRTALVRRSARQFIEQHFGLHDLAAIVVTSGRKEAAQEFTSDPALLLGAIDNFVGQRLQSAESVADTSVRVQLQVRHVRRRIGEVGRAALRPAALSAWISSRPVRRCSASLRLRVETCK